ncbi:MAG: Crp/Fnr family transcriptional regulator [Alphaproteobacteria bacterium]
MSTNPSRRASCEFSGRPDGSRRLGAAIPMCAACEVREHTFCAALNDEEVASVQAIVRQVRLAPGQMLFQEGDEAENVFNVVSGIIKLYKLLPDGRRQITGFLHPGDFLGIAAGGRYSYNTEAIGTVTLCRFPRRALYRLFDRFPKLERRLLGIATDELTAAQDQMLLLGRKTAIEKIASFLLMLADRAGVEDGGDDPVPVPMTRNDIADYLGLTMETVSRTLGRMKRDGLITTSEPHCVGLTRRDAIEELAEGF